MDLLQITIGFSVIFYHVSIVHVVVLCILFIKLCLLQGVLQVVEFLLLLSNLFLNIIKFKSQLFHSIRNLFFLLITGFPRWDYILRLNKSVDRHVLLLERVLILEFLFHNSKVLVGWHVSFSFVTLCTCWSCLRLISALINRSHSFIIN